MRTATQSTISRKWTARQEEILLRLSRFGYATRTHLQAAIDLGAERNANRILARLESDGYVKSWRRESKVYGLTAAGAAMIGEELRKGGHIEHALLRNDAWLALGKPKDWRIEAGFKFGPRTIIPDAISQAENLRVIEIDRKQKAGVNREKLRTYADLQRAYRQHGRVAPEIIFVTITEGRAMMLRKMAEDVRCAARVIIL
ncbi:replication-relaxation family protein [Terribacillus sp. 179-K 1B1 HS]|uniref:replication-relaxation family protein n=1 Tax=Terribacillus sp. 179-K 1B1 HS TaxID=3142388 RepID=UPI0039A2A0B2